MNDWSRPEPGLGERVNRFLDDVSDRLRDFWRPANAWRLGRLLGVEVWAHRGWPIEALLLRLPNYAWVLSVVSPGRTPGTYALLAVVTLLLHEAGGVLPHELAHAAAARLCRREVGPIVLFGVAAAAASRQTPASPRRSLAVVALAGPIATLALAGLWGFLAHTLGPVDRDPTLAQAVCLCLYIVGLLEGVLSLVPLGPLDGALALRTLCAGRPSTGPRSPS